MKTPKFFLDEEGTTFLVCPHCSRQVKVDPAEFQGLSNAVKVKCPCERVFRVCLGLRRVQRKNSFLRGYYVKLPQGEERGRIRVRNVSMGGIQFTSWNAHTLQVGDTIQIQFVLDNDGNSQIKKTATVRWINHVAVGCQFNEEQTLDPDLGFYFVDELPSDLSSDMECSQGGTAQG